MQQEILIRKEGERAVYKDKYNTVITDINTTESILLDYDKQKILIKAMYALSKTQLFKLEALCTAALQDILHDTSICFKIKMEETKKGVDTYFYTVSDAGETDIIQSEAGGTKNILSVCLRLIFAEFCAPKVQGPIILDEVGANISAEHQQSFVEFLRKFSEQNNRQIILISHIAVAQETAPTLIQVVRRNNESKIV